MTLMLHNITSTHRVHYRTVICYPPLLTNVSALPGETWTPDIIFSVMLYAVSRKRRCFGLLYIFDIHQPISIILCSRGLRRIPVPAGRVPVPFCPCLSYSIYCHSPFLNCPAQNEVVQWNIVLFCFPPTVRDIKQCCCLLLCMFHAPTLIIVHFKANVY